MFKRRASSLERALDLTTDKITRHAESLGDAHRAMSEALQTAALRGKAVLLLDSTSGNPSRLVKEGFRKLHDRGWDELVTLYLQKFFGHELPENTQWFFQKLFGNQAPLQRHDTRAGHVPLDTSIGAVVFTGSPADVTRALSPEKRNREVFPNAGYTHGHIFDTVRGVYAEAQQKRIPVIGLCYGHQVIAHEHGGTVQRGPEYEKRGREEVAPTPYGAELIAGVFGSDIIPPRGKVVEFHKEAVSQAGERSALLLHAADRDPHIIEGLIHIPHGQFTGDAAHDAALVKQLFADNEHLALTIQSHPEYDGVADVLTFVATEDEQVFQETGGRVIAGDIVKMFARFLQLYGKKTRS